MPSHRRAALKVSEPVIQAVKASPPATYLGGLLAGIQWGQVAAMLTALYTALLIGEWAWKKVQAFRAKRRGPTSH